MSFGREVCYGALSQMSVPSLACCLQQGGSLMGTRLLHQLVESALFILQQGEGTVQLLDGTTVQDLECSTERKAEELSEENWTCFCDLEDLWLLIQKVSSVLKKRGWRVPGIEPPGGVGGAEADGPFH